MRAGIKLCAVLMFVFLTAIPAWGDYYEITAAELRQQAKELSGMDIDYNKMDPINLSNDGKFFVACERITDIRRKAQGYTRRLKVMRFEPVGQKKDHKMKLVKIDSIDIPVTDWVNAAVGNGKHKNDVFIIGDFGNKILRVDLNEKKVYTLFNYRRGHSGFKSGPFIVCSAGIYYVTGWAYDKNQIYKGDYIIQLKPNKKGVVKLSPKYARRGVRLDKVYRQPGGYNKVYYYISGKHFLYNWIVPKEKTTYLKLYVKGEEPLVIDKGYMLVIFIGTNDKVFYSVIEKKGGPLRHYLVDIKGDRLGKKKQIGKDNDAFTYPFISDKGDVLVTVVLENKYKKVSAYVGKKREGYRLKKFLHRVDPGAMKLSGNGKVFLVMSKKGLRINNLD